MMVYEVATVLVVSRRIFLLRHNFIHPGMIEKYLVRTVRRSLSQFFLRDVFRGNLNEELLHVDFQGKVSLRGN